jgi:hypothetical protein
MTIDNTNSEKYTIAKDKLDMIYMLMGSMIFKGLAT